MFNSFRHYPAQQHKHIVLPSFREAFLQDALSSDDDIEYETKSGGGYFDLDPGSSDTRVTYFNVSSERGLWQTDPLPYKARSLQRASISVMERRSSPPNYPPNLPSRHSEPAPAAINSRKFLVQEGDDDELALENLPSVSSPAAEQLSLPIVKSEGDCSALCATVPSSPLSMRASYAPSSPLPPSSPPSSPMSMIFSDSPEDARSVSPISERMDLGIDAAHEPFDAVPDKADALRLDVLYPSPTLLSEAGPSTTSTPASEYPATCSLPDHSHSLSKDSSPLITRSTSLPIPFADRLTIPSTDNTQQNIQSSALFSSPCSSGPLPVAQLSSPFIPPPILKEDNIDVDETSAISTRKRKSDNVTDSESLDDSRCSKRSKLPPEPVGSAPAIGQDDEPMIDSHSLAPIPPVESSLGIQPSIDTRKSIFSEPPDASTSSNNAFMSQRPKTVQTTPLSPLHRRATGVEVVLKTKSIPRSNFCTKKPEVPSSNPYKLTPTTVTSPSQKASTSAQAGFGPQKKSGQRQGKAKRAPTVTASDSLSDESDNAVPVRRLHSRLKNKTVVTDDENENDFSADLVKRPTKVLPKKVSRRKISSSDLTDSESDSGSTKREAAPPPPSIPDVDSELLGLVIETLATSRASSQSVPSLCKTLVSMRPSLKEKQSEQEWMVVLRDVLEAGLGGVFGRVASSGKDSADRPLEPQWFYVPEGDADQDRAALIRSVMPRSGKRTVTKQYKQYYYKPLQKMNRWLGEDDL